MTRVESTNTGSDVAGDARMIWGDVLTTVAEKYTGGDTVAALRELFAACEPGIALRAVNYVQALDDGSFTVVNGGIVFRVTPAGDGKYTAGLAEPFMTYDSVGTPVKTEKYTKRDTADLSGTLLVIGHQVGAMGRRVAERAASVHESTDKTATKRSTGPTVAERMETLERGIARMMAALEAAGK